MARRYESDGEADRRLRAALEPTPGQVDRVAEGALRVQEVRQRRPPTLAARAAAAALALALALVLAAVLLLPLLWRGVPPETAAARYSVFNRDGVLVVRSQDGGVTSLRSGNRPREPARGMMLIVREENRP